MNPAMMSAREAKERGINAVRGLVIVLAVLVPCYAFLYVCLAIGQGWWR